MAAIHEAIAAISKDAGALAPQKQGAGVPFAFRGVDQVVSHLSPLLKKHDVIVIPEVLEVTHTSRDVTDRQGNPSGKVITQTELRTRFEFIATEDGSSLSAVTAGLAQDFADRSAAQAQSVAFRVALLQVFSLPTTDKEPEVVGEEIIKGRAEAFAATSPTAPKPAAAGVTALQGKIKALIAGTYADAKGTLFDPVPKETINALGVEISGKPGQGWMADESVLKQVLAKATTSA